MMLAIPLLVTGCGGGNKDSAQAETTVSVTGKVTFVRIPLKTDNAGIPVGLETDTTKFLTQPVSGIAVRFLQAKEESQPDGSKVTVWNLVPGMNQLTNSDGAFSARVPKGEKIFVEVHSRVQPTGPSVRIIADAAGMYSQVPQADRTMYSLRKGLDGTTNSNLPGTLATADAVINFEVGLNDKWWLGLENPSHLGTAVLESTGTGSRVLAIAHSVMKFSTHFGAATPGALLDLHYCRGVSEPRGTFVEYNRDLTPLSFDADNGSRHFFGSVRGSSLDDDAFDEGVLLPVFARNYLISVGTSNLPPPASSFRNLSPELALVEGFPPAIAAIILKSPFLANTNATGTTYLDIRDISLLSPAEKSVFSAPLISALGWEVGLKAASLPSPGTPTDWEKLNARDTLRFFNPYVAPDAAGTPSDLISLYSQITRLKEAKGTGESIDLAAIFTDATLTTFLQPFNITWPRPTTGPLASFLSDWGKDPNSLTTPFAPMAFTMAQAEELNGTFPNISQGEVGFSKFLLAKDTAYNLYVTTSPALPSGVTIECLLDGIQTISFPQGLGSLRITLRGNATVPILHSVRTRVISPSLRIPDTVATVHLDVAP